MKWTDYWRLSGVHIAAHRKRTAITIIVTGALFGVLVAGSILVRGVEKVSLDVVLRPTGGRVLVRSVAEDTFCENNCDIEADRMEIRDAISQYGGDEIMIKVLDASSTKFVIEPGILQPEYEESSGHNLILADLSTIANWLMISSPGDDASIETKMRVVEEIRARSLGKAIDTIDGDYYVVNILPGGFGISNLSLSALEDPRNPLNVLLGVVLTSGSKTLIIDDGKLGVWSSDEIWSIFDTVEAASEYIGDLTARACNKFDVASGKCPRVKQFTAESVIGDPIAIHNNFGQIWSIFGWGVIVLSIIGVAITLLTYMRLILQDSRIIILYNMMGATKVQIIGIYFVYLLRLAIFAGIFSLCLGFGLAVIVNLLNMGALTKIFALGFGVQEAPIWILGWNDWILRILGIILFVAPVGIILNLGKFQTKKTIR